MLKDKVVTIWDDIDRLREWAESEVVTIWNDANIDKWTNARNSLNKLYTDISYSMFSDDVTVRFSRRGKTIQVDALRSDKDGGEIAGFCIDIGRIVIK